MLPENNPLIKDTLELTLIPGMGIRTQNKILDVIPDRGKLFTMGKRFYRTLGVSTEAIQSILNRAYKNSAEEILRWVAQENLRILIRGTDGYPSILEEIHDAPLVLYVQGDPECLNLPSIAMVGSRRPTLYGLQIAQGLAADLSDRGICIVSGLARGIDAAVHRGCIETGGRTIAVLGCGIDIVYPPEHRQLKEQILTAGLILSEFPPGTVPSPQNFPIRNRIISGLSSGTIVVQANERSGSLITARLALEQNREVYAVPGNITSTASFGPNFLIKQGAKLVQSWKDVVEELPAPARSKILHCEKTESPVLEFLSDVEKILISKMKLDEAIHFDELYHDGKFEIAKLSELLLNLEIEGLIRRLPGDMYILSGKVPGR